MAGTSKCAIIGLLAYLLAYSSRVTACVSSSSPKDFACVCQPASGNEAPVQVTCSVRGALASVPEFTPDGAIDSYIMTVTGGGTINTVQANAFGDLRIEELYIDTLTIGNIQHSAFSSLGNSLRRLQLIGNRLSSLSSGTLKGLTRLMDLDVSYNELSQLEDALLDDVPKLTSLNLAFNRFSSMPEDVFTGLDMELESLYINDNQLTEIAAGMFNLKQLKVLDLARNQISRVEDNTFSQVPSLSTLVLLGNLLTEITQNTLGGNHDINVLQLQDNHIENIHVEAFDKVFPREVYLQNNRLTSLSSQWFSGNDKLQTVMLHNNLLSAVPEEAFRGCTALETLNLAHNRIELLQPTLLRGLVSLAQLFADHNELSFDDMHGQFFEDTTEDIYIHLHNNQITFLPHDLFSGMKDCVELSLSHNGISEIHPDVFGESVGGISFMKLDHNKLEVLEENVFDSLQAQSIDLSDNLISEIAAGAFSSSFLQTLHLNNNKLTEIKRNTFDGSSALRRLDLSNNLIDNIESGSFSDPDSLEYLGLAGNRLEKITPGVFVGRIQHIILSGNLISHIEPYSFRHLTHAPEKLDLTHNLLTQLTVDELTSALDNVDLRWNKIRCISSDLFDTLYKCGVSVCLQNNPLVCDCNLVWLRDVKDKYSCWGCQTVEGATAPMCNDDLQYNILNFPYEDCPVGDAWYCAGDTPKTETTQATPPPTTTTETTKVEPESSTVTVSEVSPTKTTMVTASSASSPADAGPGTGGPTESTTATTTSNVVSASSVHPVSSHSPPSFSTPVTLDDSSTTKKSNSCHNLPVLTLIVVGLLISIRSVASPLLFSQQ